MDLPRPEGRLPALSTVRAVFFDLDDTLYDFQAACQAGVESVFHATPALTGFSLRQAQAAFLASVDETHAQVLAGTLLVRDARRQRIRDVLSLAHVQPSSEDVDRATDLYVRSYRAARQPMPCAIELLQALRARGIHVGVVSNNLRGEQVDKLDWCGLSRLVDDLVTSEDAGEAKPHPGPFRMALANAGCDAQDAVMVGDSFGADIVGAQACGIRAIWLNRSGMKMPDGRTAMEIRSFCPAPVVLSMILGD